MVFSWEDSRRAFADAAQWFVRTTALVGDRWNRPGLGEWDVRALVGHTSRSLLTVETYLARPAAAAELASAVDYFRATRAAATDAAVATRGRDAGSALGTDPAAAVADIAARVLELVDSQDGTELLTTIAGGMRLSDYLPTRTSSWRSTRGTSPQRSVRHWTSPPRPPRRHSTWSPNSPSPTASPGRSCSPPPAGRAFRRASRCSDAVQRRRQSPHGPPGCGSSCRARQATGYPVDA